MIATPTMTAAIMPALRPRLFCIDLFRGGGAFFPLPVFILPVFTVLVLNGLLLHNSCLCFCYFLHFSRSFRFLVFIRTGTNLPECIPGQQTKKHEENDRTYPVWNPGKGIRDDLAIVLQAKGELCLPASERALKGAKPPGE